MSFAATGLDLEMITLSEVSQTEKDKYHMISHMRNQKRIIQMILFTKQKQTHRLRDELTATRGKGGGIDWEFEIDMYTLLYLKQITNKDLLYSTENSAQYSVIT